MEFPFGWFEKAPKKERRRRLSIHQNGRLGEAFVTGFEEALLFYTYSIGGVQYESSQDISALQDRLPAAPERLLGVAKMKYLMNNPANSILLCEEWSGLRKP